MPYRSDGDTKEARRRALAAELAEVREALARDDQPERDLVGEERRLVRALRGLGLPKKKAGLPPMSLWHRLRIANPCGEDWDAMQGDARARRCTKCERNVFDLTGMTKSEVEALLDRPGDAPCVRYYRRSDGTILLYEDCAPPPSKVALTVLAATACALAVGATMASREAVHHVRHPAQVPEVIRDEPEERRAIMGRMAAPRAAPPAPRTPWEQPEAIEASFRRLAPYFPAEADDEGDANDETEELRDRERNRGSLPAGEQRSPLRLRRADESSRRSERGVVRGANSPPTLERRRRG